MEVTNQREPGLKVMTVMTVMPTALKPPMAIMPGSIPRVNCSGQHTTFVSYTRFRRALHGTLGTGDHTERPILHFSETGHAIPETTRIY